MSSRMQEAIASDAVALRKMGDALAGQWMKGEYKLVKNTIDCALRPEMSTQWKDAVLNSLPTEEHESFNNFMRGNL